MKIVEARKDSRAFTLVELLVVMGVIALLMSILLPALGTARGQAKRIVCASRMRQISVAFQLYAADNDDWIITASPGMTPQDDQEAWNFELLPYICEKQDEMFDTAKLWFCPEDKDPYPLGFGRFEEMHGDHPLTSYALNGHYAEARSGRRGRPASSEEKLGPAGHFKTFQIKSASACMLMVETSHSGQIYDAEHPRAQAYGLDITDRSHHRNTSGFYHNNSMNIMFVDSHIDNIKGREAEWVDTPWSIKQGGGMFWNDLTLPSAAEQPQLWGPGYRK